MKRDGHEKKRMKLHLKHEFWELRTNVTITLQKRRCCWGGKRKNERNKGKDKIGVLM